MNNVNTQNEQNSGFTHDRSGGIVIPCTIILPKHCFIVVINIQGSLNCGHIPI